MIIRQLPKITDIEIDIKIPFEFAVTGPGKNQKETAAVPVGIRARGSEMRRISPCGSSQSQLRGIDWRAECSAY